MQPCRDVEIGARRLEKGARVIVNQHFAALGHAGQREDRIDGAARDDPGVAERPVGIGTHHERHLAPVGGGDLFLQQSTCRRRQALDAHVLSSFFLAAGNNTLFRIRR